MTHEYDDDAMHRDFRALQASDARQAPPFEVMLARARADAAQTAPARPVAVRSPWRRWRVLAIGAPLAAAAALGIWLRPAADAGDREFEDAVAAWSRTTAQVSSPTDGLLAVPGTEFLRGTPTLGTEPTGRTNRRGS